MLRTHEDLRSTGRTQSERQVFDLAYSHLGKGGEA
jgi:hypothetical protein